MVFSLFPLWFLFGFHSVYLLRFAISSVIQHKSHHHSKSAGQIHTLQLFSTPLTPASSYTKASSFPIYKSHNLRLFSTSINFHSLEPTTHHQNANPKLRSRSLERNLPRRPSHASNQHDRNPRPNSQLRQRNGNGQLRPLEGNSRDPRHRSNRHALHTRLRVVLLVHRQYGPLCYGWARQSDLDRLGCHQRHGR